MLPTKFWFIWPSDFVGEDLKKSANQKQELPVVAMFVNRSGQNEYSLERTFHRCFIPSFSSFGQKVSEEKIKMWKVNGRWTPSDAKNSHCLWQGELKTFFYCWSIAHKDNHFARNCINIKIWWKIKMQKIWIWNHDFFPRYSKRISF